MLRRPERLLIREVAAFSIAYRHSSHYDALGLTPKATQNDIKSAYYKLSMLHHPDKSNISPEINQQEEAYLLGQPDKNVANDETSARKFRAIAEAYEILGNIKLKRLYDKGLMGGSMTPHSPDTEPTDPQLKFYRRHNNRQVTPTPDGRTPIYNFDAWTKQHYSTILKDSNLANKRVKSRRFNEFQHIKASRQERYIYLCVFVILFVVIAVQTTPDFDVVIPIEDVLDDSQTNKLDNID